MPKINANLKKTELVYSMPMRLDSTIKHKSGSLYILKRNILNI